MTTVQAEAITSCISDMHDLPLDAEAAIEADEYARIMRRVSGESKGTDTPVSAFNSSI